MGPQDSPALRATHSSETDDHSASGFGDTSAVEEEAGRGVGAMRKWEVRLGTGQLRSGVGEHGVNSRVTGKKLKPLESFES